MVPSSGSGPPAMTVMKALATKNTPIVGAAPVIGTRTAPASPVSAEPKPKVSM